MLNKLSKITGVSSLFGIIIRRMAMAEPTVHSYYKSNPLQLGIEVTGIDLKSDTPPHVIQAIKDDVHKHTVLIFRNQGIVSGQRHVEISKWFGELESTFYKHPKSPHPDVFRVSNVEEEGCRGVGRTGWHIDGSFQQAPFSYSLYHMVSIPKTGDTVFATLNKVINELSESQRARWERLWMVSDRRNNRLHPLIYSHPVTGIKTLCFHLGMIEGFVWDNGSETQKWTDAAETKSILSEIHEQFVKDDGAIQYSHKWEHGDFIISDNLAVGHEASEQSQYPESLVGLRVLHRTTIKGTVPPRKKYQIVRDEMNCDIIDIYN